MSENGATEESRIEESEGNLDEANKEDHADIVSVKSSPKIKGESDEPKSTADRGLKDEETEKQTDCEKSDDDTESTDICRICRMGAQPSVSENRSPWEWSYKYENNTQSQSYSSCLGPLLSACKCRGTVAMVHAECLESWLTESGRDRCELCGHKFATKMVPRHNVMRSLVIWFNIVVVTRQVFLDVMYLLVTTPLAIFSFSICCTTLMMLWENRVKEIPWTIVAMLPTCILTLCAYFGWLSSLSSVHRRRWRRYWRHNFVIRLDTSNPRVLSMTENDNVQNGLSTS